jgi:hypothetical protein
MRADVMARYDSLLTQVYRRDMQRHETLDAGQGNRGLQHPRFTKILMTT